MLWSEILNTSAMYIRRRLTTISGEEFDEWVRMHGLGRVKDPLYVLSIQLVFNALARFMLYDRIIGDPRPSLSFSDIADEEASILSNNAFKPYDLDELLDRILSLDDREKLFKELSQLAKRYSREDASNDRLGELYEELIPNAERRKLGQFFTPNPIADLMVEYLVRNVDRGKFVDPSIGTGRFIIRLLTRDPALAERYRIIGIDISPLMLLISAVNLSHLTDLRKLDLRQGDMFDYSGIIDGSAAIINNPPYSRHHELSVSYKRRLQDKLRIIGGVVLSRYASFFGYALVYLSALLKKEGYMSFICPVEIFEAKYSDVIKKYLAEKELLERIVVFNEKSFIFPYAENAVSILFIHRDSIDETYFIKVREISDPSSLKTLLGDLEEGEHGWFFVRRIKSRELLVNTEWKTYYAERETSDLLKEITGHPLLVPFKLVAKIMRGTATGANSFFLLNDMEVKKWGIEKEFLKPALAKTRWALSYVYDDKTFEQLRIRGEKCWLFYCMLPPSQLPGTNALKYIEYGEELGLPRRSLIRTRKIWYQVEKREPPPIVFTYLSRGRPRFIYNEVKAIPLNTFLCVYPVREITRDEKKLKALLAYLNSNIAFELLKIKGRSYGGDTLKIEPRELDELPVLDVRRLDREDIDRLAALFDKLKHVARGDEEIKKEIDNTVIHILRKNRGKPRKTSILDYLEKH